MLFSYVPDRMPANHVTLRSFDEPTKHMYFDVSNKQRALVLSTASTAFSFSNGRQPGTVSLQVCMMIISLNDEMLGYVCFIHTVFLKYIFLYTTLTSMYLIFNMLLICW